MPMLRSFSSDGVAEECLLHGVGEQGGVSLAVGEERVDEESSELFANGGGIEGERRLFHVRHGFGRQRHLHSSIRL